MSTIKTTNITHGSNTGTANMVLASDGSITFAKKMFASYAIIQDQKANNTHGGTNSIDSWAIRDLNTELADPDGIVSISSNKFTLGAGNYLVKWTSPAYRVATYTTRIYDVTNSAVVANSGAIYLHASSYAHGVSHGVGRLTPSGSTEYRLEYYSSDEQATNGLGEGRDNGVVEVYSSIEIYKEA